MVEDLSQESEFEDASAGRICATCGDDEAAHVAQDAELAGGTLRRTYCEACETFHEFVPDPRSL